MNQGTDFKSRMVASVLGCASVAEGTADYDLAFSIGRLLANTGLVVATGGYGGIMEATLRGARSAGGHTIGVTTRMFPLRKVNPYALENIVVDDLPERSHILYKLASVIVGLDGDLETLGDLTYAWAKNKSSPDYKPIFLFAEKWGHVVQSLKDDLLVGSEPKNLRGTIIVGNLIEFEGKLRTWIEPPVE
jgi:uncharacterized protein (TIGR00725 family)